MWRSLFFAPANRPDLVMKLPRITADNFVVDLEDGTPLADKVSARERLPALLRDVKATAPLSGRLLVRINRLNSTFGPADLECALEAPIDGIVLPKSETAADVRNIAEVFDARFGLDSRHCIVLGIESIKGVLNIDEIAAAHPRAKALFFGAEDLATELGAQRTRSGLEVIYARQRVLMAAKAAGIAAIDQAVTEFRDDELFQEDCRLGRSFGYEGKICLNPRQAALANDLFLPSANEIDRARRLLSAFEASEAQGLGAISFEDQMVDEPLVRRARAIVALAEKAGRAP
jgi:citrate lyase subunit beta / citryl-CoA lyase